jgi:hypothetical protein
LVVSVQVFVWFLAFYGRKKTPVKGFVAESEGFSPADTYLHDLKQLNFMHNAKMALNECPLLVTLRILRISTITVTIYIYD